MSDGNTVSFVAGAPTVQMPAGFTPSAVPPAAVPVTAAAPVSEVPAAPVPAHPVPAVPPPVAPVPAASVPGASEPAPVAVSETFAEAAQTDLDKATTALGAVDKQSVQLDLDKQGVEDLLKLVSQARSLVDNVHSRAVNNLDVELKFGNNWVSDAISRRLREVAVGDDKSAVNVIGDFMQVLFEVEETIRKAARNLEEADDDAADAFGSAGKAKG